MSWGGLRQRLQHPARQRSPVGADEAQALRDSVLRHLREMCSTRRGSMRTRPDYGVPDVSEMVHAFPGAIETMAQALRRTIELYEPRLTQVRIRHVVSPVNELVIRFEIHAVLVDDGKRSPVRFETRTDATRRISVE